MSVTRVHRVESVTTSVVSATACEPSAAAASWGRVVVLGRVRLGREGWGVGVQS